MQTPYLILKTLNRSSEKRSIEMPCRQRKTYEVGDFKLHFYPPESSSEIDRFEMRIHAHEDRLFYEDGFMVEYPKPYIPSTKDKLDLFERKNIALDGAFSRIMVKDNRLTVNGSAMYLQQLFSHVNDNYIAFSNNLSLLESFLKSDNIRLTCNELFFAAHMFNKSLAYYAFVGTPFNEVNLHDSMDDLVIGDSVETQLRNKLSDADFESLERTARIDLLYARLQHAVNEYCRHISVSKLGHNLTSGKDSRTSFLMFLQNHRKDLEIVTNGPSYLPDRVVANLVSKKYGISHNRQGLRDAPHSQVFNYEVRMENVHIEEVFIPMFRKIEISNLFDNEKFVASGYLGNVLTFNGSERNQIIRENHYGLKSSVFNMLEKAYDNRIEEIRNAYEDNCHAIFNIRYNTTNKIASLCRRLKMHSFCIFESDIFALAYFLEGRDRRAEHSLHYEIMNRTNPEFLQHIPFETNKSFPYCDYTYEIQGFRNQGDTGLYKQFAALNLRPIHDHILEHISELPFLTTAFLEKLLSYEDTELPVLMVNKIYAVLGTLEYRGIKFNSFTNVSVVDKEDLYDCDFFERLYLENQIYVSGLAGMLYTPHGVFRSYLMLDDEEIFEVRIIHVTSREKIKVQITKQDDGYTSEFLVNQTGTYRVSLSIKHRLSGDRRTIFTTTFVAKFKTEDCKRLANRVGCGVSDHYIGGQSSE